MITRKSGGKQPHSIRCREGRMQQTRMKSRQRLECARLLALWCSGSSGSHSNDHEEKRWQATALHTLSRGSNATDAYEVAPAFGVRPLAGALVAWQFW